MQGNRFALFGILFLLTTLIMPLIILTGSLGDAEKLYEATQYSQAIHLYQEILEQLDNQEKTIQDTTEGIVNHLHGRLGHAYFYTNQYEKAAFHLQQVKEQERPRLILAQTFRYLGEPQKAIDCLDDSLHKNDYSQPVKYELALNYFLIRDFFSAKSLFNEILNQKQEHDLEILSGLYLSRIFLAETDYQKAKDQLFNINSLISKDDLLHAEWAYLQGETAFYLQDYLEAIHFFEMALPKKQESQTAWQAETLYYLGWSLLKSIQELSSQELQKAHFKKAESYFTKLLTYQPDEKVYLALAQCYLMNASVLKDKKAYAKAQKILSQIDRFQSLEAKTHRLLLCAESASSYKKRKKYYNALTQEAHKSSSFYAKGWYLKGLNDYNEGHFKDSIEALYAAHILLEKDDPACSAIALKHAIEACYHLSNDISLLKGFSYASKFLSDPLLKYLPTPQEIDYLAGMIACKLAENNREFVNKAEAILIEGINKSPKGHFSDLCIDLLASFYMKQNEFSKAENLYNELLLEHPHSHKVPDALYWVSECSETLKKDPSIAKKYRQQLFENYPQSTLAPAAYFSYYSYRDYLQGDRSAIKHLQTFEKKFPNHFLQMDTLFLLGLDYKRDRKNLEGKFIRKKNLNDAIEAFFQIETLFETLVEAQQMPQEQMLHYKQLKNRALVERALANQAIAEESFSAKRQIYAKYAKELFVQMNQELEASEINFPKIQEEALYLLAQHDIQFGDDLSALQTIEKALEKYRGLGLSEGYYLSRMCYEKGKIAMRQHDYHLALAMLNDAEASSKDYSYLSIDQKLGIWIQQSLCYKALNDTDQSMLILSKVINDHTISNLRIKAMYLRAKIYTMQGRHELAKKQLEATAKKGGEWAFKAKAKLELKE